MTEPERMLDDEAMPAELKEALRVLRQPRPEPGIASRVEAHVRGPRPLAIMIRSARWIAPAGLSLSLVVMGALTLHRPRSAPAAREMPIPTQQSEPVTPVTGSSAHASISETTRAAPSSPKESRWHPIDPRPALTSSTLHRGLTHAGRVDGSARRAPAGKHSQPRASDQSQNADAQSATTPVHDPSDSKNEEPPTINEHEAGRPRQPLAPEPEDEAGLLYRAKATEATNPVAALRMLERHAQYFPRGAFAEEREALMIRLERRLGDDASARQRAEHFRERFPHSVYLRAPDP